MADVFDTLTEPKKQDVFDSISGDIFDKVSVSRTPIEYEDPWKQLMPGFTGGVPAEEMRIPPSPREGLYEQVPTSLAEKIITGFIPFKEQMQGIKEWRSPETLMESITMYATGKFIEAGIPPVWKVIKPIAEKIFKKVKVGEAPIPKVEPAVVPKSVEVAKPEAKIEGIKQPIIISEPKKGKLTINLSRGGIEKKQEVGGTFIGDKFVTRDTGSIEYELTKPTYGIYNRDGNQIKGGFDKASEAVEQVKINMLSVSSLEPTVKGGQVGELPKYAEKSSINLERIETTDDIKHFVNDLTISQEAKIGKRKVTWEETRKNAEDLGWNISDVKQAWNKKGGFNSAEIEAARQLNVNAVTDLFNMIKSLPAERTGYTPEMRATLLDALDVVSFTSKASSEAGRALNIHKKVISHDVGFQDISNLNKILNKIEGKGIKRTDDIIDGLKNVNFNNIQDVNQFIYSVTKTRWEKLSDITYSLWLEGLLSNPMTHIKNTTSNALTLADRYPEGLISAGVEAIRSPLAKIFPKLGGSARERFIGETKQEIFSFSKALFDATKKMGDSFRYGEKVSKIESHVSPLPPQLQKWLPTRMLEVEDAFFKRFIEADELSGLAYRKASQEGLKGQAFKDRIKDIIANPTEEMLEQVAQEAKYLTYQKDLGKVGKWVMKGRDIVPGLKYFVPFIRTPINIAKFSLERTPLNIPRIVYKVGKGELQGGELSDEVAKVLMGGLLGTTSYLLVDGGYITGGGPKQKAQRDELFRTGWQPYSFKANGNYYSYGSLEPLGSIVGTTADFYELSKKMTEDEKIKVGNSIAKAISRNITNKTFTQGFARLNDAITDPEQYLDQTLESLGGSVVPGIAVGITRVIDPNIREVKGILDRVRSRIPILSEDVPKRFNIWGEPIERGGHPLSRILSPFQISEAQGTPIDTELVRLKLNLGMPSRTIKGKEMKKDKYVEYLQDAGQKAKTTLNQFIQGHYYNQLNDEQKQNEIKNIVNKIREESRGSIMSKEQSQLP